MNTPRYGEGKRRYQGIEVIPKVIYHVVAALHAPYRCIQYGTAGVTERFPWFQLWLLSYHAFAFHLLYLAVCVGDDPMTIQQFGGFRADITDGDGVGEDIAVLIWNRLIFDVIGLDLYVNLVLVLGVHFYLFMKLRCVRDSVDKVTERSAVTQWLSMLKN